LMVPITECQVDGPSSKGMICDIQPNVKREFPSRLGGLAGSFIRQGGVVHMLITPQIINQLLRMGRFNPVSTGIHQIYNSA